MDVATRLVDSITNRFIFLANFPYAGRARDDDFGGGSRSFAVGEYVIVYRVEEDDVLILRVVHGKRNLEGLFERQRKSAGAPSQMKIRLGFCLQGLIASKSRPRRPLAQTAALSLS